MINTKYLNSRSEKVQSSEVLDDYVTISEFIPLLSDQILTSEIIHTSIVFLYLAELFSVNENKNISLCYTCLLETFNPKAIVFSESDIEAIQHKTRRFKAEQLGYVIDIFHQFFISNKQNDIENKVKFNKIAGYRKFRGAFYTPYEVALLIVNKTYDEIIKNKKSNPKILDMGCGTGVFLSCLCHVLVENNFQKNEILNDLIFGIDVENLSTIIAQIIIQAELKTSLENLQILKNIKTSDIIFNKSDCGLFAENNSANFYDAIVMNPPYDRLKADGGSDSEKKFNKNRISQIKNDPTYKNSSSGSINMYSLFIDKAISLLKKDGVIGAIVPMTLIADKSAANIRKYFLDKNSFHHLFIYPESAKIFENVTQSCLIFIANFLGNNKSIKITNMNSIDNINYETIVPNEFIRLVSPTYLPIPCLFQNQVSLMKKLHAFPRIKDIHEISNRRGELDLTLDKKFLSGNSKSLLKGISISPFKIKKIFSVDFEGFVKDKAKSNTARIKDIFKARIAGQQVSNVSSDQRLKFAKVPENFILGNSLNYLTVDEKLSEHNCFNIYTLLGILNSDILNWRFKLTSSNNHVNNYELDDLPIPINASQEKIIRLNEIVLKLSSSSNEPHTELELRTAMNEAVLDCYNLTNNDFYKN